VVNEAQKRGSTDCIDFVAIRRQQIFGMFLAISGKFEALGVISLLHDL